MREATAYPGWPGRIAGFAIALLLAGTGSAHAQMAVYSSGSVHDLNPPATQSTGPRIRADDMEYISNLADNDVMRRLGRPVGRLALKFSNGKLAYCTASLIDRNLILTNNHCVRGEADVTEAVLWMGYLRPESLEGGDKYPVDLSPVESHRSLDYAILRVSRGSPGDKWGTVSLSKTEPGPRQSLVVIHHPGGFVQRLTQAGCRVNDPATSGDDIFHRCDTKGGSSGAPIFDNETRTMIALHYRTVDGADLNAGVRVASLTAASNRIARLIDPTARVALSPDLLDVEPDEEPPPPADDAGRVWAGVQNTTSIAVLRTFAEEFPDSVHARLAKARIAELEGNQTATDLAALPSGSDDVVPAVAGGEGTKAPDMPLATDDTRPGGSGSTFTLDHVRAAGQLGCGVAAPDNALGFTYLDALGEWQGFDVDICRAVAAAVLGDSRAVRFHPVTHDDGFLVLRSGEVDVLARAPEGVLGQGRDRELDLAYAGTSFHDGQGFMIPRDYGITRATELSGASVCVVEGSTQELTVAGFFESRGMDFSTVEVGNDQDAIAAYLGGRCDVLSDRISQLARIRSLESEGFAILPETISTERYGPVVRDDGDNWPAIVGTVLNALVLAEEKGVTRDNVDEKKAFGTGDPQVDRLLGVHGDVGARLGLDADWAVNAIRAAGNYGEIHERNLGPETPMALPRGQNALSGDGGLVIAQPLQ